MRLSDRRRIGAAIIRGRSFTAVAVMVALSTPVWSQAAQPPAPANQAVAANASASAPAEGAPKFRCEEPIFNFPEVWSGEIIEHAFVIHNDGDAVLKFLEVRGTCGCTATEYDKEIPPGGQGKIVAKVNTRGMRTAIVKTVSVKTNDPDSSQVTLQLKGVVKTRISIDPPNGAQFGNIKDDDKLVRTVKISNNTETPLKLEAMPVAPQMAFSHEIKEVEAGKVYQVTITIDRTKLREGPNPGVLQLKTGIEEEPTVSIPVNLFNPPVIQVMPATLAVAVPVATSFHREFTLTYNGDGEMKVTGVKTNEPGISVKAEPLPAQNTAARRPAANGRALPSWKVLVDIPAGWDPEGNKYEITVTTDVKDKPELIIPVHTFQQRPQGPELLVGRSAPVDVVKTIDGKDIKIGGSTGRVAVTSFWTSWCPHCKRMLPMMQKIADTYASRGVDFNMISLDTTATPEAVMKVAHDLGLKLPVGLDPKQVAGKKYNVRSFPVTFLMGKNGIIEAVQSGAPADFEEQIKSKLDVLLAGKTRADFSKPGETAHKAPTSDKSDKTQVTANPMLMLDSLQQDMGTHKPGAAASFSLFLRNGGAKPLTVNKITTSEGLKVDPDHPKSVQANAPAAIRLEFTAPKKPGPFEHEVTIETNDPSKPKVAVKLTGKVRQFIEVDPPTGVDFGRRPVTFSMDRMATLMWYGEGPVNFLEATSDSPKFEASIKPIRNSLNAILNVKAKPPFEQGEHTATITVKTDCKEQPTVEVPVKLYQPERIEVMPAVVSVPKATRIQQATVTILNNSLKSLTITDAKASNPKIRWQFYPEPDGITYKLHLTLPPDFAVAPEGERVTIYTADPEYGEIVVPIKVVDSPEAARGISRLP